MGTRIKTFESTGIAPNGRLYAGDLNAIQDKSADQSNYAQQVDVATLSVGESALKFIRYGAGEGRITGHLRIDGIFRGLGGLYAGAFTTAQRDGILANQRPYGLIILNTTNNRYEWNSGTDPAPNWQPISPPLGNDAISNAMLQDNSVGTAEIVDGSVTAAELAGSLKPSVSAAAGTEALRALGVGANNAAAGNDARFTDQRVPTDLSVTNAKVAAGAGILYSKLALANSITNADIVAAAGIPYSKLNLAGSITAADVAAGYKDGTVGTASMRTLGAGAQQAAPGDDARFSNQRVPTDLSVTTAKIVDGAVNSAKIADGSIAGIDIGAAQVTPAHLNFDPATQGELDAQVSALNTSINLKFSTNRIDAGYKTWSQGGLEPESQPTIDVYVNFNHAFASPPIVIPAYTGIRGSWVDNISTAGFWIHFQTATGYEQTDANGAFYWSAILP